MKINELKKQKTVMRYLQHRISVNLTTADAVCLHLFIHCASKTFPTFYFVT